MLLYYYNLCGFLEQVIEEHSKCSSQQHAVACLHQAVSSRRTVTILLPNGPLGGSTTHQVIKKRLTKVKFLDAVKTGFRSEIH